MSEQQIHHPFQPDIAAQEGIALHEQWQAMSADGLSTLEDRQRIEAAMLAQTTDIFSATGVELQASDAPLKGRTVESDFEVAISVAEEAATLGFSLDVDDETAKAQAERLVEDYIAYSAPVFKNNAQMPPEYHKRFKAKLLLSESSARDLARRIGIESPDLDRETMRRVKDETGVEYLGHRRAIRPVQVLHNVRRKSEEDNPNYMGPRGTHIHVSGIGFAAIEGYRHGKPVVRGQDGQLQTTLGRYR